MSEEMHEQKYCFTRQKLTTLQEKWMWLDNIWVGETMKFRLLILSPLLFLCSNCVLSSGFRIGYSLCIHPFDPLFIIYKMWFMAVGCMFWLFLCYNFLHSGHCHIFSDWTRKNNGYLLVMFRNYCSFQMWKSWREYNSIYNQFNFASCEYT